ncbi:MAG TPA: MarR family transcriptional regulator [Candidatus Dormibacteraeota bacterium]|jgi:DNA-binding MarR family transcriptional regulator|nr:MarR family transcriptional regulator [Candidatus Dormibacteraeota bacterium]
MPGVDAVMAVFDEAALLHLRLEAMVERIHGSTELTRACRGVLRDLERLGQRTVPQLARRRPVSRQTVQAQVNRLVEAGMAELTENPDHATSRLVGLTPTGRAAVRDMWAREMRLVETLDLEIPAADLERAAGVLAALRQAIERPAGAP